MSVFSRRNFRSFVKRFLKYTGYAGADISDMMHAYEGVRISAEPTLFSDTFDIFLLNERLGRSHSFSSLRDDHQGKIDELYIVGSGPSVNDLNLEHLRGKKTIYLNAAVTLEKRIGTPPFFVVFTDSTSFYRYYRAWPDMLKGIPPGTNFFLSFSVLKEMALTDPNLVRSNNIFLALTKTGNTFIYQNDPDKAFDIFDKFEHGRIDGGTVMADAVRLAAFLRARRTYLLGFDIGNNMSSYRFYETKDKHLRHRADFQYDEKILPFMKTAKCFFQANNLEIYNCSPISKLPFEVIPYSPALER